MGSTFVAELIVLVAAELVAAPEMTVLAVEERAVVVLLAAIVVLKHYEMDECVWRRRLSPRQQ